MHKHLILLVEDNEVIQKIALISLRRYGVDVDTARTGLEAVKQFAAKSYDLVFMDVAMPEMDGLTATQQIRKLEAPGTSRVPIVGLTASASREECLMAGMDDYIIKPPDYQRVLERWLPDLFSLRVG